MLQFPCQLRTLWFQVDLAISFFYLYLTEVHKDLYFFVTKVTTDLSAMRTALYSLVRCCIFVDCYASDM